MLASNRGAGKEARFWDGALIRRKETLKLTDVILFLSPIIAQQDMKIDHKRDDSDRPC
jgi:hypothetical protein